MRAGFVLAITSLLIPLCSISISARLCEWFNLYSNALSDLGHSQNSPVAWVFNLGLSTGGVLMIIFASTCIRNYRGMFLIIVALGYLTVLIAVFDLIYKLIHYIVSLLFFIALMWFILYYTLSTWRKRWTRVAIAGIIIVTNLCIWFIHLTYRTPPGAALPELVSISTTAPFYLHAAWRLCNR